MEIALGPFFLGFAIGLLLGLTIMIIWADTETAP